jgi:hypothetical protein
MTEIDPTKTQPLPGLPAPPLPAPATSQPAGGQPKLIFNFSSHFLGDQVKGEIKEAIGPFAIANIKVQLNLNELVGEYVFRLCRAAIETHGQPDYIIPPANGLAGLYVGRFFTKVEGFPPVVTYTPVIRLVALAGAATWAFGGVE